MTTLVTSDFSQSVENETELWRWASAEQYARLVAANPNHLLVRVGQRFSFAALEAACQEYRRYTGKQGQEATHTVAQLCRALLVKHLRGWSYRRTSSETQTHLLLRWFVGYDLNEPTLSFVTLQRFGRKLKVQRSAPVRAWARSANVV